MRVVVLADTHAPRRWRGCPPQVAAHLADADLILHAGDVCEAAVLMELAGFAPVRAVLGNNDLPEVAAWGAPETLELELAGLRVAMLHDSGPAAGRPARMRRRFPAADLVVYGHSHTPVNTAALAPGDSGDRSDRSDRVQGLFNPGSPTDRRRQPHGTVGVLQIEAGRLLRAEILPVT